MKIHPTKLLVLSLAALLHFGMAQAQETADASGGDASGSGGSVSYSIGQVVYTTITSGAGKIAQGVQQPYEVFAVGTIELALDISFLAYPNPTTDELFLQTSPQGHENLSYAIYDIQNKLLCEGPIVGEHTKIAMNKWPPASYLMAIRNRQGIILKSFAIIKY